MDIETLTNKAEGGMLSHQTHKENAAKKAFVQPRNL